MQVQQLCLQCKGTSSKKHLKRHDILANLQANSYSGLPHMLQSAKRDAINLWMFVRMH